MRMKEDDYLNKCKTAVKNGMFSYKQLIEVLKDAEEQYRKAKLDHTKKYNELLLDTNWDEINKERIEKGIVKITNQDMKKAYITNALENEEKKLLELKLEYDNLFRIYEISKHIKGIEDFNDMVMY